ncbi:UbiA family prenyltransferase [Streptomyces sp. DSM 44917]|uniref:UbiA family prenyltransferase n=1 Tax=Streptomyces boetiae TaxID=3075541 RepID=A0ABU2L747_9ACTN|nr:UbiA family prenyltransferase [Streptomyces sp. DSM 44917]MDT0307398.1 UbiA family prenyltransferase [Streptomyces sp. DSM 44917]
MADAGRPHARPGPPGWRAVAELLRAPAALTVPGDGLAGAAAAGRAFHRATPLLTASSLCLYAAGMALNDWADRAADARDRPERPLPSGRIAPSFALGLACGLTTAGLGLAGAAGGRRALAVAGPLAGAVWAYDLRLKRHPVAGPAAMAAARGLDVLLGAGPGRLAPAAPAAALIAAHTAVVTALGRFETRLAPPALVPAGLAATALIAATAARPATRRGAWLNGARPAAARAATAAPAALYALRFGAGQLAAARRPRAGTRPAVAAGLSALLPLQAACAARAGAPGRAAALLAGVPLTRPLFRKVNPT